MSATEKITYAIGWALHHPLETFAIGYIGWNSPRLLARAALATAQIMGPATYRLGARLAVIAFEESAMVRGATQIVTKGVPLLAAAGLGWGIGAVVGTTIISQAEKREMVYEGATADVIDFYLPGGKGHYFESAPPPGAPTADPMPGYFNIGGNIEYILQNQFGIEKGGGIKQFF